MNKQRSASLLGLPSRRHSRSPRAAATATTQHDRRARRHHRSRHRPADTTDGRPTADRRRSTAGTEASGEGVSLAGDCPETVVIQTDWMPEAEHGFLYQMVGEGYEIDAGKAYVTGPLIDAGGNDTGVEIQIRSGGAAQNFAPVTQIMYADDSVTLGYVYTDEAIQFSGDVPDRGHRVRLREEPADDHVGSRDLPGRRPASPTSAPRVSRSATSAAPRTWTSSPVPASCRSIRSTARTAVTRACSSPTRARPPSRASARPSRTCTRTSWPTGASPSSTSTSTTSAGRTTPSRSPRSRRTSRRSAPASPSWCRSSSRRASTTSTILPARTPSSSMPSPDSARTSAGPTPRVRPNYGVETIKDDGLVANGPDDTVGNFDLDRVNALIELAVPIYTAQGSPPEGRRHG